MKLRNQLMLTSVALAAAVLATPNTALAQPDLTCDSTNSPVNGGTYHNVTAELGCQIILVHVTGNLTVVAGGSLLDEGSTIDGNLQASKALWIELAGGQFGGWDRGAPANSGQIGGNLQITGTTANPLTSNAGPFLSPNNFLCNTYVGGDVQVQNNSANSPFVIGGLSQDAAGRCGDAPLIIGGNLQVHDNAALIEMEGAAGLSPIIGPNPFCPNVFATLDSGHGNYACGNIEVHNNTGTGGLEFNSAGGNCQLHNNLPVFSTGRRHGNSADKNNDCITPN